MPQIHVVPFKIKIWMSLSILNLAIWITLPLSIRVGGNERENGKWKNPGF